MGLLVMILGLVLFFAAHVFTTKRETRAQAIARLGEGTYKILYSLVSLAGLIVALIALASGLEIGVVLVTIDEELVERYGHHD